MFLLENDLNNDLANYFFLTNSRTGEWIVDRGIVVLTDDCKAAK